MLRRAWTWALVGCAVSAWPVAARADDPPAAAPPVSDPKPAKFGVSVSVIGKLQKLTPLEQARLAWQIRQNLDAADSTLFFSELARIASTKKTGTHFMPALTTSQGMLWLVRDVETGGKAFEGLRVPMVLVDGSGLASTGRVLANSRPNPHDPEKNPKEFWAAYGLTIEKLPGGVVLARVTAPAPAPPPAAARPAPCQATTAPGG